MATPYSPSLPHLNHSLSITASVMGLILSLSGLMHGIFEVMQGPEPTPGFLIEAIGPQQRFWPQGNEPAFTLLPTYLSAGIATIVLSLLAGYWSARRLAQPKGPAVFLLLFILLTLAGGGIGHILLFMTVWAFASLVRKPLPRWNRLLGSAWRNRLASAWKPLLLLSSLCILYALFVAVVGFVPGIHNPDTVVLVMLAFLIVGYLLLLLTFVTAIARDLQRKKREGEMDHG